MDSIRLIARSSASVGMARLLSSGPSAVGLIFLFSPEAGKVRPSTEDHQAGARTRRPPNIVVEQWEINSPLIRFPKPECVCAGGPLPFLQSQVSFVGSGKSLA